MSNGIIAIVGATATGKSHLAVRLAERMEGEIINADSRQVYRYMDIGTAKPSADAMQRAPHHLYSILDPDQQFNLALWLERVHTVIQDILGRDRVPLLVGGSGLYVWGLLEGLKIPHIPPDKKLRQELEIEAKLKGPRVLHQRLIEMNPEAAVSIHPNNTRRIIRALEVCLKSEIPFSRLISKGGAPYPFLMVGLSGERDLLYRRIDQRTDQLLELGLVEETKRLLDMGYSLHLPSMSSVGYKQVARYIKGETSLENAMREIKTETHRLARHQNAWFKASDSRIHWYNIANDIFEAVLKEVKAFLNQGADANQS